MEKVKSEILRQLGLSSAPNVTASKNFSNLPVIQKQILELQRLKSEEGFQNDPILGYYHQFDTEDNFGRSRVKRRIRTIRGCSKANMLQVANQHPLQGLVGAGLVRRTQCCKWPLKIDFKEFGWDWVLSPTTYSYCAGDCPGDSPYVQMHPGGRCTPIRMYTMHMLYLDADFNVIKVRMPNMRVRECGCS